MAKLDPAAAPGGPVVTGLVDGGFAVGERRFPHGLLLTPDAALDWRAPPLAGLTPAALKPATAVHPEFLLLGTGATLVRPPSALVAALDAAGIGIEAMDSRAAARAWGVLRAEGRPIAAALLPWR